MARLYIGNIPHSTTEHELQAWLEERGFSVESIQVIRDLETGGSRGFAFAELPQVNAKEAVDSLNGQRMEGHNLRVSEARPVQLKTEGRQTGGIRTPRKRAS
jgi:RNA recognition motif-containing protein